MDSSRSEAIRIAIKGPSRVTFDPGEITRELNENTGANQDVGSPVTAAYTGTCTLTHTLVGADAASFQIDSATGQIKTRAGVTYDHEARSSYTVTVAASDANCGAASAAVTINVNDVNEPPRVPREVVASPAPGSYGSITVRWTPPDNTGRPDITGYDIEARGTIRAGNVAGNSFTLTGLRYGRHEIRVRAKNAEGDSDWSDSVPQFASTPVQFVDSGDPLIPPGLGVGDIFRLLFVTKEAFEANTATHGEYEDDAYTDIYSSRYPAIQDLLLTMYQGTHQHSVLRRPNRD